MTPPPAAGASDVVTRARQTLGPVGAKFPTVAATRTVPIQQQRDSVRRLEKAGYRAAWNGEGVGGKDAFVELAVLLAATERIAFGSAIANMWARPAQTAHGAAILVEESFPGRFVLGLGAGYPAQAAQLGEDYGSPLTKIREYVKRMPVQEGLLEVGPVSYPLILAANGPKMLALAAEIADGAHPTVVPPEYTANARQVLGPDKLLVVGMAIFPDTDRSRAREAVRHMMARTVGAPGSPYGANLVRLGYPQEEITNPTDRVVDAMAGYGSVDDIAAMVRRHLDAGADHVIVTPVTDYATGIDQLESLAELNQI